MKILLFRKHLGDPLSFMISALTRGQYVHAAVLTNESTLEIYEAFYPVLRKRTLLPEEIAGVDVFAVAGLSAEMQAAAVAWCEAELEHHVRYSITDLFRFLAPVRALIGDPTPEQCTHQMFCSQFAFEAVRLGGGISLLQAPGWDIAPSYLAWSPFMVPCPSNQLKGAA